jgi:hypothetical protein
MHDKAGLQLPDFYNPVGYSILKRERLIRQFPGVGDVQVNFSQLHQDMFVLCMLDGLRGGTYLEIGAYEPIFISNTYLLETTFGWKGAAIELNAELVARHRARRSNPCHREDALKVDYDQLAKSTGLPSVVDYLSIDVDPSAVTLAALKRIPHERYRFRVITYEHDYSAGGARERLESRAYLGSLGYQFVVGDVAWKDWIVEDWWIDPALVDGRIAAALTCDDDGRHEHDRYIYGGYARTKPSGR